MDSTFRSERVPTWAKVAAWAVPLTTIPSITWRMITVVGGLVGGGNPCVGPSVTSLGEAVYLVAVLPSVQLGLALLTVGLVRPWGEVLPRWIPVLGGRRVPLTLAVGAATTGAVLLALVLGSGPVLDALGMPREPLRPLPPGCTPPGWDVMRWYLPLYLWPPLLLAVTWHHLRRRRGKVVPPCIGMDGRG